jgi:peptidoglycan/LPS O-acetylase OafA/YrhL
MDALAFGTLLASIEASRPMATLKWVFLLILVTVPPVLFALWTRFATESLDWVQVIRYTFIAMIYWSAIGLVIAFQNAPWVTMSLANRPLRFAGKISYGLYVYHPMCFLLIFASIPVHIPGVLRLGAGIAATFVLSWISFRCFESYFLRLKRFFAYDS